MNFGHEVWVEVQCTGVTGQRGLGSYRLWVHLQFRPNPSPQPQVQPMVSELAGQLAIRDAGQAIHYVGRLLPQGNPMWRSLYQGTHQLTMELELDHRQLEAIERVRQAGDVTLLITLWSTTTVGADTRTFRNEFAHLVNQGVWVAALREMGYARILLLEVPIQPEEVTPALEEATVHLAQAQAALLNWDAAGVLTASRKALEALGHAMGVDPEETSALRTFMDGKGRIGMDKALRVETIRRLVQHLASAATHTGRGAARFQWSRDDAAFVLTVTAALLRLQSQQPMQPRLTETSAGPAGDQPAAASSPESAG